MTALLDSDPEAPAFGDDPDATLDALRESGPVLVLVPANLWLVLDHAALLDGRLTPERGRTATIEP